MRAYLFANRVEAGRLLAQELKDYANHSNAMILALPRGGVPVAYEIARMLHLPLDIWLVRKLGVPGHEELAMGAIALGGICVMNHGLVEQLAISYSTIRQVIAREEKELQRRSLLYRGTKPVPYVHGKTIFLVDDGIATGATIRSAAQALRQAGVAKLIIATPVGVAATCKALRCEVDEVVCLAMPEPFIAVGQAYQDFHQVSDEEVQTLLKEMESENLASD